MLSKGDDYPLHQTAEPIAFSGTDRNFYDRYFFNGYNPDGSGFFALAFGIYPHLDVADAHFCAIRDGQQHCLHASRELGMERMDLTVGPIRIEVIEPLRKLRIIVAEHNGIAADIVFTGRAFPLEEPRFTRRIGPRAFMDYTRMTQNGRYEGWIEIDGRREAIQRACTGTRDRSWGVRPIGVADAQPHTGARPTGFFWQWTPMNFARHSVFFHLNADGDGPPWNLRAAVVPDGAGPHGWFETSAARMEAPLIQGTRWPARGELTIDTADGPLSVTLEPLGRFYMRGLGYTSPKWNHGLHHGALDVEREDFAIAAQDPARVDNFHVQIPCRAVLGGKEQGVGVFEQLVLGINTRLDFKTPGDVAK
ncbi:hypothetical protein [Novosphingobium sp. Gsoil 351]|uniref:hypothetical protein n=1 Tax=Novosphingobium sp. Gsoil 351 TaxID=2675225 RepID=UPI0012B4A10F|nr:hypothetical protein [Novosphingobium sp. Gsoil 351]QGN53868.1 hypothetical protein GKE62_04310 [Novosphingobium sp. Gsoil 351]